MSAVPQAVLPEDPPALEVTSTPTTVTLSVTPPPPLTVHWLGDSDEHTHYIPTPSLKKPYSKKAKKNEPEEPPLVGPPPPPVELGPCPRPKIKLNPAVEGEPSKRLWTRIGMEYTFMPNYVVDKKDVNYTDDGVNQWMRMGAFYQLKARMWHAGYKHLAKRVYLDSHVIEIPSTPVNTYRGVWTEYNALFRVARRLKLVAQHTHIGTGSNHINLDLCDRMAYRLVRDIASRPYLYWAFNDPCDLQDSAIPDVAVNPEQLEKVLFKYTSENALDESSYYGMSNAIMLYTLYENVGLKCFKDSYAGGAGFGPVNFRHLGKGAGHYKRLKGESVSPLLCELRFLEAPAHWPELKLQIEFVDRYLRYLAKVPFSEIRTPKYQYKELANLKLEDMEQEFKDFLRKLKLSPRKYGRYFENMRKRYALGKEYLK